MKRGILIILGLIASLGILLFLKNRQPSEQSKSPKKDSMTKVVKDSSREKRVPQKETRNLGLHPIKDRGIKNRFVPSDKKVESSEEERSEILEDDRPDQMVYAVDREGIDAAMRAFMPKIRECYSQARIENPEIEGRIVAAFTIEENTDDPENSDIAKISEVEILESELEHEDFENCIMDNLDLFWFEPPENGSTTVRYPFLFSY